jgi:competence protein ComEA
MIRRILRSYLSLTRGERNGVIMLALLILVLLAGRIIAPLIAKRPEVAFSGADTAFLLFRTSLQEAERKDPTADGSPGSQSHNPDPVATPAEYFDFDPNHISYEDLLKLGLSASVARILINYRKSGGKFNAKTDLMKVYGLGKEDFHRLEPYIDIRPEALPADSKRETMLLELNGTDSLRLQGLYGIGPVFASRIIRYRDLLGGYYAREQLKEVYGLGDEQYQQIIRHVHIDTSQLRRMDLNTVEREALIRHPYLTVYQADALMAYRDYKGQWEDILEIRRNQLIPDSVFLRIRPYLKVDR